MRPEPRAKEHGDKIPPDLRAEVEEKVSAVRTALHGGDGSQIRRAADDLSQTLQKVGSTVYGQPGAGPQAGEELGREGPEGTVEGEFREV